MFCRLFCSTPIIFLFITATCCLAHGQDRVIPLVTGPNVLLQTNLVAQNHGSTAAEINLSGFDSNGRPLQTQSLFLEPGEAERVSPQAFGGHVAYVLIEGSQDIGVSAFYSIDRPFSPWATIAETTIQATGWQWQPIQNSHVSQKIALVNTGYRGGDFQMDLVRLATGAVIDTYQGRLEKGAQSILYLDEIFQLPRVRNAQNFGEALVLSLSSSEPLATTSIAIARNRQAFWENPGRPISSQPPVRQIPVLGNDTFPEGVATHRQTGEIFVGGLGDGSIQRIVNGQSTYFIRPGQAGLKNVVGLEVDAARNRLWVCNSDFDTFQFPELVVFDIAAGTVLGRFVLPDEFDFHFFNEVTLDSEGNAYATDSTGPAIWTVDVALQGLEVFVEDASRFQINRGFNLNGIVATPDGRFLITALPRREGSIVYRIDLATKDISEITIDGLFVSGDGLTFLNQTDLVAIGFDVTMLRFDCHFDNAKLLEFPSLTQHFDFATTGDITQGNLIVVNGQLDHFFSGEDAPDPFTVTEIPLARLANSE